VSFGKVTVTREGLVAGSKTFSWDEVENIEVEDRAVRVHHQDRWRTLATTGQVDNAHVLDALVTRVKKARGSGDGNGN
jgi:uncharacterized protein (DUF2235 family)